MAGVVATLMTNLRTALQAAPTSWKLCPPTFRMDDLPAGVVHQVFRLKTIGIPQLVQIYGGAGSGSLVEYEQTLQVEIHWDPQVGADSTSNTIADDLENLQAVMLKQGNRTAGIVGIGIPPAKSTFTVTPKSPTEWVGIATHVVRFRVAQDLT